MSRLLCATALLAGTASAQELKLWYDDLWARHVADHQKLFGRVAVAWGETAPALRALPKAWPAGRVSGLCARGGFEADIAWQDGKLAQATIRSRLGSPCKVHCGEKTADLRIPAGGAATINGDLTPVRGRE
jgi:hypothetical protein